MDTGDLGGLCSSFRTPGGKGGVLPRGGWVAGAGRAPRVKGGSAPPLRKLGFVEGGPEAAKVSLSDDSPKGEFCRGTGCLGVRGKKVFKIVTLKDSSFDSETTTGF